MSPTPEEALEKAYETRDKLADNSNTYYDIREDTIEALDIIIDCLEAFTS